MVKEGRNSGRLLNCQKPIRKVSTIILFGELESPACLLKITPRKK